MSQICCPTCGNALSPSVFIVDDEARIVVCNGRFASMTDSEFAIFQTLYGAAGRMKTKEQLLKAISSIVDEAPEIKIVDVYICKLRKKLAGMSLSIETLWGDGYRIIFKGGVA